jgi:beta-glucuronidase
MQTQTIKLFTLVFFLFIADSLSGQSAMINVEGRKTSVLNGKWEALIDPTNTGEWRQVWKTPVPEQKTDFFEYAFEGGPILNVPGDFNTQMPELTYMEGTVWYKQSFSFHPTTEERVFIHFGAVNYEAHVFLNGKELGRHEGGFTPFQFEVTDLLRDGENDLIVGANNQRKTDGIPGQGYDWFNYGGITRDVTLISTSETYLEDYLVQVERGSHNQLTGWIQLNGDILSQDVAVSIPELDVDFSTKSDNEGYARLSFHFEPELWSPDNPKLYEVIVASESDTVIDRIGFRSIEVNGSEILLNGKKVFLKGVNIHEEAPFRGARAFSREDAELLLGWAKDLGCNLVRLSHYPHNKYMIRVAEEMGLMVWSELPVYQHIKFDAEGMQDKIDLMMREMVRRDRNSPAVVIWCVSNETYDFTPGRNEAHKRMADLIKELDDTRPNAVVINNQGYNNNTFNVWDKIYNHFDIIALNEYLGWYAPWQGKPSEVKWEMLRYDKPVIISEFGGEALFNSNHGPADEAAWWREEYQANIYRDQIEMFPTVPNLCGVIPWLLVDYRSMGRMHPVFQQGYNRKGLISEQGEKKQAWYIMKKYFDSIKNEY